MFDISMQWKAQKTMMVFKKLTSKTHQASFSTMTGLPLRKSFDDCIRLCSRSNSVWPHLLKEPEKYIQNLENRSSVNILKEIGKT